MNLPVVGPISRAVSHYNTNFHDILSRKYYGVKGFGKCCTKGIPALAKQTAASTKVLASKAWNMPLKELAGQGIQAVGEVAQGFGNVISSAGSRLYAIA